MIYLYKVCVVANGGGEGGPGIIRVGVAGAEVGRVIGRCEAAHNRLPVVGGQHGGRAEVLSYLIIIKYKTIFRKCRCDLGSLTFRLK